MVASSSALRKPSAFWVAWPGCRSAIRSTFLSLFRAAGLGALDPADWACRLQARLIRRVVYPFFCGAYALNETMSDPSDPDRSDFFGGAGNLKLWASIVVPLLTCLIGSAGTWYKIYRETPVPALAADLKTRGEPERSDKREAVEKFVTDYFKASEGTQVEDAIAFFDGKVDFQNEGWRTREQLSEETFSYHQKYPERHYDVSPHMDVFQEGDLTKVRAMFSYRLRKKEGVTSGDALNLLWLRSTDKTYKITKVREAILSSDPPATAKTAEASPTPPNLPEPAQDKMNATPAGCGK